MKAGYVKCCIENWMAMIFIHCEHHYLKDGKPRRADEWRWLCDHTREECGPETCKKLEEIKARFEAEQAKE